MLQIRQLSPDAERIELYTRLPWGTRLLLFVAGLVVLGATWQLTRGAFNHARHPGAAFFLFLALGTLGLSLLLFGAALLGQSTRLTFDRSQSRLVYTRSTSILPPEVPVAAFGEVVKVQVVAESWSDGPPSYTLKVNLTDGTSLESGSTDSRREIEHARELVAGVLDRARSGESSPPAGEEAQRDEP